MLSHPAFKAAIRQLSAQLSTYLFAATAAALVALLIVVDGMGRSQQGNVFGDTDRILVVSNAIAPRYMLPVRYVDEIQLPTAFWVTQAVAVNFVPALVSGQRQKVPLMAADPRRMLQTNTDLVVWPVMADRWADDPSGLLVGRMLADRLHLGVGDTLSLSSPLFRPLGSEDLRFRVRAIYDVRDNAYPSFGAVMHDRILRPNGQQTTTQGANSILVLLKDRGNAGLVSNIIDSHYRNMAVPTRTRLREQFVEAFNSQGSGIGTLIRMYGFAGIAAGLMLLVTFCFFSANQLHGDWERMNLVGFDDRAIVARFAVAITLPICGGIAAGGVLTLVAAQLFAVLIQQNFSYFSASPRLALLLLPTLGALTWVVAVACLLIVRGRAGGSRLAGEAA